MKYISSIFAKVDKAASNRQWESYVCTNPDSEYNQALLNVSVDGTEHKRISWSGCPHGERKVISNAKKTTKTM